MQTGDPKIRKHLREKHRIESLYALDFDDDFITDDQVWPVFRDQLAYCKTPERRSVA